MKGMIYKDLLSLRTILILGVIEIIFICSGMGYIILSEATSSAGSTAEAQITLAPILLNIGSFVSIVCFPPITLNCVVEDKQTGWAKFCRCSPHKVGDYTKAKMISLGITTGLFLIATTAVNLVFTLLLKSSIELAFAIPFVFACFTVTLLMPIVPLIQKFGRITEYLYFVLVLIFGMVLGLISNGAFSGEATEIILRLTAYLFLPLLVVISTFYSYNQGKKMENVDL